MRKTVATLSGVWEVRERSGLDVEAPQSSAALGMSLRDWLLLIPDYDGCPHELECFAEAVRYVGAQLGARAERTLLLALGSKLTRRARALFAHRLHRHGSLNELLEGLRASFGDLGAEAALLKELQCAHQDVDESAGEFGARLDKIATRLCGVYEAEGPGDADLREANKSLVRRAALAGFCRGLSSAEMEVCVGAYEPRTLDEATRVAVALENGMRRVGPKWSVNYEGKCGRRRRYRSR